MTVTIHHLLLRLKYGNLRTTGEKPLLCCQSQKLRKLLLFYPFLSLVGEGGKAGSLKKACAAEPQLQKCRATNLHAVAATPFQTPRAVRIHS